MARRLHFRHVEAFKAVMEQGSVSLGAAALNISQPAMSKLISNLEADTGLRLFDRLKGRLIPTDQALRLRDEVQRLFVGLGDVESAVEAIRRQEQGQLLIGTVPVLSGTFIEQAMTGFLKSNGGIFCSVEPLSSQAIISQLVARTLDVGVVGPTVSHPDVDLEPLMEHPLVCVMPLGHPFTTKRSVTADDLDGAAYVGFSTTTIMRRLVDETFRGLRIEPDVVLVAGGSPTVCQFVAAGFGVSLVHPLMASDHLDRLVVRPFVPEIPSRLQIGRTAESRNAKLIDRLVEHMRATAGSISRQIFQDAP